MRAEIHIGPISFPVTRRELERAMHYASSRVEVDLAFLEPAGRWLDERASHLCGSATLAIWLDLLISSGAAELAFTFPGGVLRLVRVQY